MVTDLHPRVTVRIFWEKPSGIGVVPPASRVKPVACCRFLRTYSVLLRFELTVQGKVKGVGPAFDCCC